MPKVVRNNADICGGTILQSGNPTVFLDGITIAVIGDPVASHPPCPIPATHCNANMVQGSPTFFIHGKNVCRVGDT